MMFKLNVYMIYKMGWQEHFTYRKKSSPKISNFVDDGDLYYHNEKNNLLYTIKQIQDLPYKIYEFFVIDLENQEQKSYLIDSNIKLFELIRENLACNLEYQRFFQINSIFKK